MRFELCIALQLFTIAENFYVLPCFVPLNLSVAYKSCDFWVYLKLFIFLQSRPLEQQQQQIQQQQQEGSNRNSSTSQGSTAGSEGSRGECPPAVEVDPEWAPHVDLGKQMATLHALLVDSLPKLPAGRIQVRNNVTRAVNSQLRTERNPKR